MFDVRYSSNIYNALALVDLDDNHLFNKNFYDSYIEKQMKNEEFCLRKVIEDYHKWYNDYLFDPTDYIGPVYGSGGINRFFILNFKLVISKYYCNAETLLRAKKYGMIIID